MTKIFYFTLIISLGFLNQIHSGATAEEVNVQQFNNCTMKQHKLTDSERNELIKKKTKDFYCAATYLKDNVTELIDVRTYMWLCNSLYIHVKLHN